MIATRMRQAAAGGGFVGVLDGLSNVAAAYGVRRLRTSYTGNLLRLRRSSDNAESDFGYISNGDLNTSAITTWLGGANGYVATWYDQSGGGVNWTQITALNQPPYAANQTSGKSALGFVPANSNYMSRASSFFPAGSMTAYVAMQKATTHTGNVLYDVQGGENRFLLGVADANMQTRVYRSGAFYTGNGFISATNAWHIMGAVVDAVATTDIIYRDGNVGTSVSSTGFSGTLGCMLGSAPGGATGFLRGAIAEVLIFTEAHGNATRDAIESDMGAYYGVSVV